MAPRNFTPDPDRHAKQTRFLAALARGARPPDAAAQAGAALATLYTWRRRNKSFRAAWKKARDQARMVHYALPPRPRPPAAATQDRRAEAEPKRLHIVVRSFIPGRTYRHILTETWPDGSRTKKEWDAYPTREELLEDGEDPELWDEARRLREAGGDVDAWLDAKEAAAKGKPRHDTSET